MLRNKYGLQAGAARMGEPLGRMRGHQKRAADASSQAGSAASRNRSCQQAGR